jgi:Tol biopolymer transport system component
MRATKIAPFIVTGFAAVASAADAVRWTPPSLSTDQYESSPTFSPDGREMFLFRGDRSFSRYELLYSHCVDGHWSAGFRSDFAAPPPVDEADPAFSPDGRTLFFVSTREDPRPPGEADFDIWSVDRDSRGRWGKPARLPEPVNSPASELLPRPQPDGSLLFGSDRAGGHGGGDIYIARRGGDQWRVENVGAPVNTAANEYEADLSRDGKLMMVIADRGDRSHLYPYRREHGEWIAQPRIVPKLEVFQVGPLLSPRGDRLLFAQADEVRSGELFLLDLTPNPDANWPPVCEP